jgi:hypothetical protein
VPIGFAARWHGYRVGDGPPWLALAFVRDSSDYVGQEQEASRSGARLVDRACGEWRRR